MPTSSNLKTMKLSSLFLRTALSLFCTTPKEKLPRLLTAILNMNSLWVLLFSSTKVRIFYVHVVLILVLTPHHHRCFFWYVFYVYEWGLPFSHSWAIEGEEEEEECTIQMKGEKGRVARVVSVKFSVGNEALTMLYVITL